MTRDASSIDLSLKGERIALIFAWGAKWVSKVSKSMFFFLLSAYSYIIHKFLVANRNFIKKFVCPSLIKLYFTAVNVKKIWNNPESHSIMMVIYGPMDRWTNGQLQIVTQ